MPELQGGDTFVLSAAWRGYFHACFAESRMKWSLGGNAVSNMGKCPNTSLEGVLDSFCGVKPRLNPRSSPRLAAQADVNAEVLSGKTALMRACELRNEAAVRMLLEAAAEVERYCKGLVSKGLFCKGFP